MEDPFAVAENELPPEPPLLQERAETLPAPPATTKPPRAVAHGPGAICIAGQWWKPAGFWARAAAFLLDCIFLSLISDLVILASGVALPDFSHMAALFSKLLSEVASNGAYSSQTTALMDQVRAATGFAAWINIAVCAVYYSVMHSLAGATLGKAACGLRVLRRDLKPLSLGGAALRYLVYLCVAKLAYTAWLMPFDKERRTLYDILLNTNVYRRSSS